MALWKADREVIVWATNHGCAYHWGQAVWHKIADVGLQLVYEHNYDGISNVPLITDTSGILSPSHILK